MDARTARATSRGPIPGGIVTGTGAPMASPNRRSIASSSGVQATVTVERNVHHVRCARSTPHLRDVIVHSGAHIQGGDMERGDIGKTETNQRVDQRKRLNRLRRIEVIAFLLVADVEPGTDHRHAPDGTCGGTPSVRRPATPPRSQNSRARRYPTQARARDTAANARRTPGSDRQARAPPLSAARGLALPSSRDRSSRADGAAPAPRPQHPPRELKRTFASGFASARSKSSSRAVQGGLDVRAVKLSRGEARLARERRAEHRRLTIERLVALRRRARASPRRPPRSTTATRRRQAAARPAPRTPALPARGISTGSGVFPCAASAARQMRVSAPQTAARATPTTGRTRCSTRAAPD